MNRLEYGLCSLEGYMLEQATQWLIECYPDYEDHIEELEEIQIYRAIERYYEGGIEQFIKDGQ